MVRLFETHRIRETQELNGIWDFYPEGSNEKLAIPVPGCWEQNPKLLDYRGKGTYNKAVYIKRKGNLRLEFKGVSHTADVFFDGKFFAHHYNAFTPFSFCIKNVSEGTHELKVNVDNTFGEHSALHIPNDYYTYGGITRPAVIEYINDVYIEKMRFMPYFKDNCWYAKIEIDIYNISDNTKKVYINSELCGINIKSDIVAINGGEHNTIALESEFSDAKPWSQTDPKLYLLNTVLFENGKAIDDLIERVGFRTISIKGTQIYLNDEKIYLKGFNRHEDYAVDGCSVSFQHMVQDIDLIQEANANAIRTCHYPNDERFLDLCDERGIMVWEENHARGLLLKDMQNKNFEKQCEDCIREMIDNHFNHPSIIIWGILNECAAETEEGRAMYKKQFEQIRIMDSSRPVTSATCRHFTDITLDLEDIVSFNMYSGWYIDCPIDERNNQEIEWIRNCGGDGKPIIVSEVGAAAIYGYRDRSRCKWSEERQSDIIRDNLDVYMRDNRITGVFIWQFADCRVTEEGDWFATRARCHNNKGVVDEYRRPKMSYDTVAEMFKKYN